MFTKVFGPLDKQQDNSVLIIGSSYQTQASFISKLQLQNDNTFLNNVELNSAVNYPLGYAYLQYKDDSGELLSTLEIHTVSDLDDSNKKIVNQILTKNTLVIFLLDFNESPSKWLRQLNHYYSNIPKENETLIVVYNLEFKPDWNLNIFEYIQISLRLIAINEKSSLIYQYSSSYKKSSSLIELISTILKFEINLNFNLTSDFLSNEILIKNGNDSFGKIKTLTDLDIEELVQNWELNNDDNKFIKQFESVIPEVSKENNNIKTNDIEKQVEEQPEISYQQFLSTKYQSQLQEKPSIKEFLNNKLE